MEENIIKNFLNDLKSKAYSKSTIKGYCYAIKNFNDYLKTKKLSLDNFSNKEIQEYKNIICNKYADQTINLKLAVIKAFITFSNLKIDWNISVIKTKNKKDSLNIDNVNILLDEIDKFSKKEIMRQRDKLIFKIIYYTGLRTKEVINLKPENLNRDFLLIGNKKTTINKDLSNNLNVFIKSYKIRNGEYIFFSLSPSCKNSRKTALTEKSIEDMFNKYKKNINKNLSIRDIRNSYIKKQKNNIPQNMTINFNPKKTTEEVDLDFLSYLNK